MKLYMGIKQRRDFMKFWQQYDMVKKLMLVLMCILVIVLIASQINRINLNSNANPEGIETNETSYELPAKVMTYNILMGLEDPEREEKFVEYLTELDVDVLALQELNGLSPKELKTLANKYNHHYSVQLKRMGYPVGITSKYPIEVVKRLRLGLHHGALHVKIQGVNYIVVHLSPLSAEKRQKEIDYLANYLEKENLLNQEDIIILGDFNAHSEEDSDSVDAKNMEQFYDDKNLIHGEIDYSVISSISDYGFIDSYTYLNQKEDRYSFTYPSDNYDLRGERIDYIFVSQSLEDHLVKSEILVNDETKAISDHFPILLQLE